MAKRVGVCGFNLLVIDVLFVIVMLFMQLGTVLINPQQCAPLTAARLPSHACRQKRLDRSKFEVLFQSTKLTLSYLPGAQKHKSTLSSTSQRKNTHGPSGCRPALHTKGLDSRDVLGPRTTQTWRTPGHGLQQIDEVCVAQRVPHSLQGGAEVAAVAPPRASDKAVHQAKRARAPSPQQSMHKAQERHARWAAVRIRGPEHKVLQAGVRGRGRELWANQHAAVPKDQAAQVWEAGQAAQGPGVQGAPNLHRDCRVPLEAQLLEASEHAHALGQLRKAAVGQLEMRQARSGQDAGRKDRQGAPRQNQVGQ